MNGSVGLDRCWLVYGGAMVVLDRCVSLKHDEFVVCVESDAVWIENDC